MKLSEAIRKGCQTTKQAYGTLYFKKNGEDRSCALGAAYIGAFGEFPNTNARYEGYIDSYTRLQIKFPELQKASTLKKSEKEMLSNYDLEMHIMTMNDTDKLTREEIANILEMAGY